MPDVKVLLRKIDSVRGKRRRVTVMAGLFKVIAWAVMLLVLIFLLDWGLGVSKTARLILVLGAFSVLAWVIWTAIIRELQEYLDDDEIALMVEESHPELEGRLIATIQLSRKDEAELGGVSEDLITALEDETLKYTGKFRFSEIITLANMLRFLVIALIAMGIVYAFGVYSPTTAKTLMERLALKDAKYPTKTKILDVTGDVLTDKGDPLTLKLRAGGIIPSEAVFHVRFQNGEWSKNFVFREGGDSDTFTFAISRIIEPLEYYVEIGDAKSFRYQVKLIDRPDIYDILVKVTYPSYTGWGTYESEVGTGEIRGLTGSKAAVQVKATKKINSARFEFADGTRTDMAVTADKLGAAGSFTVGTADSYCIVVTDTTGTENKDPAHYQIVALRDQVPTVAITKPTSSKRVTGRSVWDIEYEIRDDFGVSQAWFVYSINDDERTNRRTARFRNVQGKLFTGTYSFDVGKLSVSEGDSIRFWIEADDNINENPNRGKSEAMEFIVISAEEKRMEILERWRNALDSVQGIITDETDAKKGVDTIRTDTQ